jgi:hypothetical protein
VFAARSSLCGGLALCSGGVTVMLGSGVAEPVAVCDTAVLLSPHSNAVDKMAIAERAKRLDEDLMNRVLPLGLATS